ncbi:MAG: hypothetical protein CMO40_01395 [Verrucomicrobiaceae bacterium]|nr:hypothetical protein [Verrucomicrobiaceae bacterium]
MPGLKVLLPYWDRPVGSRQHIRERKPDSFVIPHRKGMDLVDWGIRSFNQRLVRIIEDEFREGIPGRGIPEKVISPGMLHDAHPS